VVVDLFFCPVFANFLDFVDTRTEDRPKSPAAVSNIDQIPQETPQHDVAESTEGAVAVARGIPGCQSVLAVSSLVLRVLVICCRVVVLTESW